MTTCLPSRMVRLAEARARWGDRVDRLGEAFWRTDPLADAAVAELDAAGTAGWRTLDRALKEGVGAVPAAGDALRSLFAAIDRVPAWVDRDRVERAGRILFRAGPVGGIVLGARCLVAGYCSPAGNKPLVLTGRLQGAGVSGRLAETGRYVSAVCEPGGLERAGPGFALSVRVRLMHARVRALCRAHPQWRRQDWGEPINQHDLVATHLLFSIVFADGLRRFGISLDRRECEDWLHLWRWASTLMGVEPDLLPGSEPDAYDLAELIHATEGAPDEDSRRLASSILSSDDATRWPGGKPVAVGLCRALLGPELADGLGLPSTPARHLVRAMSLVIRPVELVRRAVPRLEQRMIERGRRAWDEVVEHSAGGHPLRFEPPRRLRTLPGT